MSTGGSVQNCSIDGRGFAVAADADVTVNIGGLTNEVQANGDGSTRTIKTRVPWSASGLALVIDESRGDLEFLREVAARTEDVPIALEFVSGTVRQGRGTIVDNVELSSQSTTAPVTLSGPGKLERQ